MVGIPVMLGVNVSPVHAVVQGSGPTLRMDAAPFRRELEHSLALQRELSRYGKRLPPMREAAEAQSY